MNIIRRFNKRHQNLHSLIVVFGVILIWRGVWSLLDYFLIPEEPVLSYAVGGLIGVIILLLDDFRLKELREH